MLQSADGKPIVVFKRHSSRLPSGEVVHRKAQQTQEFFLRNQFVRCTLPDGRVETGVVVHDPVPLNHWKSPHAVEVLRREWKTRRQLVHTCCALGSYRFDRFALSALGRLWRQVFLPTLRATVFRHSCPQTSWARPNSWSSAVAPHVMCTAHSVGRSSN